VQEKATQRSRFLQEYKSETSYTPEDGQRQLNVRPSTIKLHADGNISSKLVVSILLLLLLLAVVVLRVVVLVALEG
jgi:hypothetical protein